MNVIESIDISVLSSAEKIDLMELLWRDLSKNPENIEVPKWHLKQLEESERAIAAGTDEFIDIDEFETELREKLVS